MKRSESAADQQIEFESDRISLDIPMTGVVTQNRGWKILPLNPPVVCLANMNKVIFYNYYYNIIGHEKRSG